MTFNLRQRLLSPLWALLLGGLAVGCAESVTAEDEAFGSAAIAEATALIEAHPQRIAGKDSLAVAGWIASRLEGCAPQCVPFETTYGTMCNVLAQGRPVANGAEPVAIVASHFDTKDGIEGFVGANDGASTTGLLITLAQKSELPVLYLFLDGEECKVDYSRKDGLHGAWHAASGKMGLDPGLPVIVIDMLGDKDFTPTLASNGSSTLNHLVYRAAEMLGLPMAASGAIVDDHVPFVTLGWRAIDIIDFWFGPDNAWWHTPEDTMDKVSADSLAKTAALLRVTIDLIREENKR